MTVPSAEAQLVFLRDIQRVLSEGQFVSTYKYALLLSIADLCVERGDDTGDALRLPAQAIAERFIRSYWRQCAPYPPQLRVLRQNTGKSAAILRVIGTSREAYKESLAYASRDKRHWHVLVSNVEGVVLGMPLWKLQTIAGKPCEFLYRNEKGAREITLRSGVAFCFRKFYELVVDLVRGAWIRYIRRHNHAMLGTAKDLEEFMFGSERGVPRRIVPALDDLQRGRCFYCTSDMTRGKSHVDHFVP